MNILFCGDKNIEDGLFIAIHSLLKNVKEPLNIYILTMTLENETHSYMPVLDSFAAFLDKKVKAHNSEKFVRKTDITELFLREIPTANMDTRFTPCCMLRLFADEIKELPDKLLYLDNDVVCRTDISELYHEDINEYEIAGVLDYYGKWFFRRNLFKLDYVNSGVMLLNLKMIRQTGLFKKCRQMCSSKKMFMPDQSAINKLANKKKLLPEKYNDQRRLHNDTALQHFTTSFRFFPYFHTITVKPWQVEKVHSELGLWEYDDILEEYEKMKQNQKRIPIFFTIDNGYAPYLGVAIHSLITNASEEYKYKIIVIYQDVSEENRECITAMANENFEIEFVEMKHSLESITDRKENRLRCDYFTMTIYFRLFIADMYPEYDKAIYIDSDIVVPGDISELYNIDLKDNIIGACPDISVEGIPELAKYMEKGLGIDRHHYINSGVLLMDLKKMREKKFAERFLELMNKYHFDCVAPDQDYINAMCAGNILYLDECWDAMPNDRKEPLAAPKLIHYNLFDKPWCYDNIQYEEYFWKYAKETPYYQELVDFKRNYTDEQKQSDKEHMDIILRSAASIPDTDVTFKKMHESGAGIRV